MPIGAQKVFKSRRWIGGLRCLPTVAQAAVPQTEQADTVPRHEYVVPEHES